jgi:hypothetical protein
MDSGQAGAGGMGGVNPATAAGLCVAQQTRHKRTLAPSKGLHCCILKFYLFLLAQASACAPLQLTCFMALAVSGSVELMNKYLL